MTAEEVTLGEIYRSVQRLEAAFLAHQTDVRARQDDIVDRVQAAIGPVATLDVRVEKVEGRLERVEPKVDHALVNAAFVSGGIAVLAWLAIWLTK